MDMKRTKRRYLALQLEIDGIPSEREVIDSIWIALTKLYGEVGASLTGFSLLKYDVESKIVVIRASLASLLVVRASIATITKIAGKDASLSVLAISGTLRALYDNIE